MNIIINILFFCMLLFGLNIGTLLVFSKDDSFKIFKLIKAFLKNDTAYLSVHSDIRKARLLANGIFMGTIILANIIKFI